MGTRIGVFLDRDGTLNEERDFIRTPDELALIPGAGKAVARLNNRGIPVCVISNQSGIARGYFTESDLVLIHERLRAELSRDGATIDRIYYCPHHPVNGIDPYGRECDCRKPAPGMLKRAETELDIDPGRSFVVGDRLVDVQTGMAVGATTILVLTGYGRTSLDEIAKENSPPDYTAPSIVEAVDRILASIDGEREGSF